MILFPYMDKTGHVPFANLILNIENFTRIIFMINEIPYNFAIIRQLWSTAFQIRQKKAYKISRQTRCPMVMVSDPLRDYCTAYEKSKCP